MSRDIQWSAVDVPFQGGLDERLDPRVLPPGLLTELVNGEFRRPGGIRKRRGTTRRAATNTPGATALVRHGRELLALDADGDASTKPSLWTLNEVGARWHRDAEIPTATLRVEPLAADLSSRVRADVAAADGYLVHLISALAANRSTVRVINAKTRALVVEADLGAGADQPRAVAAGNGVVALLWKSGNTIRGAVVDCTATPTPTVSTPIDVVTDVSATWQSFDADGYLLSTNYVVAYRQTGTNVVRVIRLDGALSITHSATFGTNPQAITCKIISGNVFANWLDSSTDWTYAVRSSTDLSSVLAATAWFTATTGVFPVSAVSADSSTTALLFCSERIDLSGTDGVPMLRWRTGDTAGALGGTTYEKRRCEIAGKPWAQGPLHHIWVRFGGNISGNPDTEACGYGLLDISSISATAMVSLATQYGLTAQTSELRIFTPWSSPFDSVTQTYRGCCPVTYAPLEERAGARELSVSYTHSGRYRAVQFAGCTYIAAGCVMQWDGSRLQEVGFAQPPELHAVPNAGAGTFGATGTYRYRVVYETIDGPFARHRSTPSASKPAIVSATTDEVTLSIEPLTVTRRFQNLSTAARTPRTVATIFRAGPGSNVYQRLHTFVSGSIPTSDPEATTAITFVDTGTAAQSPAETLYTVSGELANDHPYGGATALAVHKDRLWLGGGEDAEMIWYSKPAVEGRPAEFSILQRLRVPGQSVVAIESMDDYLLVLCERGLYGVFGEGPTALGTDGTFATPALLDPSVGCVEPRSTVVTPAGCFFRSQRGIELFTRGREVVYIGGPIETTLATYPKLRAACVVPERGQVRFALLTEEETDGRVVVYDYVEQKWAVWQYATDAKRCIGMQTWNTAASYEKRGVVMLDNLGNLYEETDSTFADRDTTDHAYMMSVATGWLSFGLMNGYLRVRKVQPLVQRLGDCGLTVTMSFRYDDTATASRPWTQAELLALDATMPLRIFVPQPKQTSPAIKVRLAETTTAADRGSEGFAAQGLSFEIGRIPGLRRLPAANTR